MYRGALAFVAVMLVAVGAPLRANAQPIEGTWKVSHIVNGNMELASAIVKLNIDGGKTTGELVFAPKGITLASVKLEGNALRMVFKVGNSERVYEGPAPKKADQHLVGSLSIGTAVYPAGLTSTSDTEIDPKMARRELDCPPLKEAQKLASEVLKLRFQAQRTKDKDEKADLLKQAAEAEKTAKMKTPALYREVVSKYADTPMVFEAVLSLMRTAQANEAKTEDVKAWATVGAKAAKAYGSRYQTEFAGQIASVLVGQEGFAPLAVEYAREAEKALTPKTPAADQVRVLGVLSRALRKAGKDDDAKAIDVRVNQFEEILDKEYSTKMPGFKGEMFTGRKSKGERAVFMELFTGATCPPCVAADLAFDVLMKSYKASDLVLIQYHMHIPGPDPLTNADTEARWKYYGSVVRGVPSVLFDGKFADVKGGGPASAAEKKYQQYRSLIDPLLEEEAGAKITATAKRDGDKIDIHVKVSGLNEPGADKKLRILLAEETVRYPGSNGVRFHHNVVRAFPGGVEGKSLMEAATKHNASINVKNLRGNLEKYLNDSGKVFANPARPMVMEHLRVIAFVQDDANQEILQAVMVEVNGK
jgi:hypothetical protein